jgi:hypothetical protein
MRLLLAQAALDAGSVDPTRVSWRCAENISEEEASAVRKERVLGASVLAFPWFGSASIPRVDPHIIDLWLSGEGCESQRHLRGSARQCRHHS